ncbi:phosphatase protein [Zalerion maritima]|uniref:Phosphatase protein n=1 Tax=Zalerion maritima TaxID=339359 RepID=A0AAD5RYT6_9PEZI|nr:phosphatase protein [Zalerion maritima]
MEVKKSIPNVTAINAGKVTLGFLNILEFHIVFVETKKGEDSPTQRAKPRQSYIAYPLLRSAIFRPTPPTSGQQSSIRLQTRDFTFITFNFETESRARGAFECLRTYGCRLASIDKLYAFSYKAPPQERGCNGWEVYNPRAEYRRQGISDKLPDKGWRISTINKNYTFSPTYPELIVVPSSISDNVLKYAGTHRSRARIPALSYLHPVNNCSITRSSQPHVGITRKRSLQDERLVAACFSAIHLGPSASQVEITTYPESELSETEKAEDNLIASADACYDEKTGKRVVYGAQQSNLIVDARPTLNAAAMQLVGKGSENMDFYKCAKKAFLYIANIHVMRASLDQVFKALQDADISPLPPSRELLNASGWIGHIMNILDGSALIARQVGIHHSHVLIHCSDGWDRTSQLSAMAQIMLDPYYRTFEGFIVLVEKEWLAFGHNFQRRSGILGHEDWFKIQNDAMAGSTIQPGENEGQGDGDRMFRTMVSATRRFLKQPSQADEIVSDDDLESVSSNSKSSANGQRLTVLKEISPVFHQFLEATQQLVRQCPNRFEFNERFLRRLFYHTYSCQYGEFLYNSEKDRKEAQVAERTSSVWDYFLSRRDMFTNKQYDDTIDDTVRGKERLLFPNMKDIKWWHELYGRTDEEMNVTKSAVNHKDAIAAGKEFAESPKTTGEPGTLIVRVETESGAYQDNQPSTSQIEPLGVTSTASDGPSTSNSENPVINTPSPRDSEAEQRSEDQETPPAPVPSPLPVPHKSVLAGVESAHGALIPEMRPQVAKKGAPSPTIGASDESLVDGISSLASVGGSKQPSTPGSGANTPRSTGKKKADTSSYMDQEMTTIG